MSYSERLQFRKKNNSKKSEESKQANNDANKDKDNQKKRYVLPERQFKNRRSLLTELFEDNIHIRTVYNIIIAFLIVFVVTVLTKEYFIYRRFPTPINLIYIGFGKVHLVFIIWIINNITTTLMYYAFLMWGMIRQKAEKKKRWDNFCIMSLITYYLLSFSIMTGVINKLHLPFASAMILTMESIRFLMKIHAFVRDNAGKILRSESEDDNKPANIPPLAKFLYFLYVPTAVYRDEYPRTDSIRWSFVLYRALEIFGIILFYSFGFEYVARTIFKDTCIKKMSYLDFWVLLLQFSIPSTLMVWGIFFVFVHSTQNLVGELLRFGDRMFYLDWWTTPDIQQYYRRWNMIIGDWLYTYVHKDICENLSPTPTNRLMSKVTTVMLSAIVHEWIVVVTTGFFLPIVTFNMIITVILMQFKITSKNNAINILALVFITIGSSCIGALYSLEYFARENLNHKSSYVSVFFTKNCLSEGV